MENIRDLLRTNLARSLAALPTLDRLTAAWPVAAGKSIATQATLTSFENGILTIHVQDPAWLDQLRSMRPVLQHDLTRIAQVPITAIHFESTLKAAQHPGLDVAGTQHRRFGLCF